MATRSRVVRKLCRVYGEFIIECEDEELYTSSYDEILGVWDQFTDECLWAFDNDAGTLNFDVEDNLIHLTEQELEDAKNTLEKIINDILALDIQMEIFGKIIIDDVSVEGLDAVTVYVVEDGKLVRSKSNAERLQDTKKIVNSTLGLHNLGMCADIIRHIMDRLGLYSTSHVS